MLQPEQCRYPLPGQKARKQIPHHPIMGKQQLVTGIVLVHGHLESQFSPSLRGKNWGICPTVRKVPVRESGKTCRQLDPGGAKRKA